MFSCASRTTTRPSAVRRPAREIRPYRAATSDSAPRRLFCFGVGYVGLGLAHYLRSRGWEVQGTCAREEQVRWLRRFHIHARVYDGQPILDALQDSPYVLNCIPPRRVEGFADRVLNSLGRDATSLLEQAVWIGNLSSTSVYGDWDGAWVDESSETRGVSQRGKSRLRAEKEWMSLFVEHNLPVHTFRLGGIYGPGRSLLDHLVSSSTRRREAAPFVNRCHVYDICQALRRSMESPTPGEVYNVVDDDPVSRREALSICHELLQKDQREEMVDSSKYLPPSKRTAQPTDRSEEPSVESKRVLNGKIKELGVHLLYPNVRTGLEAICEGDIRPFITVEDGFSPND